MDTMIETFEKIYCLSIVVIMCGLESYALGTCSFGAKVEI